MNILEEIAESYTYNGVVSLKALDDDIVTLENQIDTFKATLGELKLRGKRSTPLVEKIREAKIKLSLLKAVYKKESDKSTPDDVILSVLGISGKDARETEAPKTVADEREPKKQNFESTELENTDSNVVTEIEILEDDKLKDDEVVIENPEIEKTVEPIESKTDEDKGSETVTIGEEIATENSNESIVEETPATDNEKSVEMENCKEKEVEATCEPSDVNDENGCVAELNTSEESKEEDGKIITEISIDNETGEISIPYVNENDREYIIPKKDKDEIDSITYPGEPVDNFAETISIDKTVKLLTNKQEECDSECPTPGLEDYFEPIEEIEPMQFSPEVDLEIDEMIQRQEEAASVEYSENVVECENSAQANGMDARGYELPDNYLMGVTEFHPYDAFPKYGEPEIYSSFDLSPYTNMVNTESVTGAFDNTKKTLEVTFFDVRDYSVFVKLLKEKKPGLFGFLEKPKSIFMDVHEKHGDEETVYHYEFVGCRLKKLLDTKYAPKDEHGVLNTVSHECTAVFKYKKLKLS